MKLKSLFLLPALLGILFLSCDNDDDQKVVVPSEVQNAFKTLYPSAKNLSWEDKNGYKVAEFKTSNNEEANAWFDNSGSWYMTETDIAFNNLPQAVKTAFQGGEYKTWQIDDIDLLEKKGLESVYIIEVEQQEREADLHYTADGLLIKVITDNSSSNHEYRPEIVTTAIETFIQQKYPQARIVETEREGNRTEVDIIHNSLAKEVCFDTNNNWLYTSWDVPVITLPQTVKNVVNQAIYTGYIIEDADYIENSQGMYYLLELEKGNSELQIKVSENGNVLN